MIEQIKQSVEQYKKNREAHALDRRLAMLTIKVESNASKQEVATHLSHVYAGLRDADEIPEELEVEERLEQVMFTYPVVYGQFLEVIEMEGDNPQQLGFPV